jgi:ketosteroid isomerase-like protein
MKILTAILWLVVLSSLSTIAQPALSRASQAAKTGTNKKLEREILKAESLLGKAIAKRDVKALDKILTDYYADSYEGSERASTKKTALDRCLNGTLEFYRIDSERTITSSADIVTVEGVARSERKLQSGTESESEVRIKRLWTKKNGRWQLVAQSLDSAEEETEK